MDKSNLPAIRMDAKPKGLDFKAPKSAMQRWDRTIKSKASTSEVNIDVMGEIGDSGWSEDFVTAGMVQKQLRAANNAPLLVSINSPGGDAREGIAIYNLLREYQGKITVNVLGIAASAASVIAMAGDTIKVGEAAQIMIHSAWGLVMGNRIDMRAFADYLDQVDTEVAGLYARRSGRAIADVLKLMEAETYMTGADAVKNGFADITVADDKKKTKALADSTILSLTPPSLLVPQAGSRPVVRLSAGTIHAKKQEPTDRKSHPGAIYLT